MSHYFLIFDKTLTYEHKGKINHIISSWRYEKRSYLLIMGVNRIQLNSSLSLSLIFVRGVKRAKPEQARLVQAPVMLTLTPSQAQLGPFWGKPEPTRTRFDYFSRKHKLSRLSIWASSNLKRILVIYSVSGIL